MVFREKQPTYRGETHLHDAAYEDVVALVVDPVLQHHFVHHGYEDLVLRTEGVKKKTK